MMLHNVKDSSETPHFSSSRWLPVFTNSEFNKCMLASQDIPSQEKVENEESEIYKAKKLV